MQTRLSNGRQLTRARPLALPRIRPLAGIFAAALVGSLALACDKPIPPPPSWPPGTVLALNGIPISADDVDDVASWYARLQPEDSPAQLRRLALSNVIFPRLAARGLDPEFRTKMRALAEEYKLALDAGTLPPGPLTGPMEHERTGIYRELGLEAWSTALDAQPGRWSSVIETPGAFEIVRLKERGKQGAPIAIELTIAVFDFAWIDTSKARETIAAALDHSKLVFVDESWREFVPLAWQYRLQGESP